MGLVAWQQCPSLYSCTHPYALPSESFPPYKPQPVQQYISPWVSQAPEQFNQSIPAQKSTNRPAFIEEKYQRQGAQTRSWEPWGLVSAPHRTSCWGTLGRLLDFSEFLFLHPPNREFPLICTMGILFRLQNGGL